MSSGAMGRVVGAVASIDADLSRLADVDLDDLGRARRSPWLVTRAGRPPGGGPARPRWRASSTTRAPTWSTGTAAPGRPCATWAACPEPEAHQRVCSGRALRRLPAVAGAYEAGRVPVASLRAIARVMRNPRVRWAVDEVVDALFAEQASTETAGDFEAWLRDWEALVDQDGAGEVAERTHERRRAAGPATGRRLLAPACRPRGPARARRSPGCSTTFRPPSGRPTGSTRSSASATGPPSSSSPAPRPSGAPTRWWRAPHRLRPAG